MTRRTQNDSARSGFARLRRVATILALCCGCSGPILRPQSPEARIDLPPMPDVKYVSEYTHPYGMNYLKLEAVSLVTGLNGTGSDPPPTPQRAALLEEMKRREVANPNEILSSGKTSMVLARRFCVPAFKRATVSMLKCGFPPRAKRRASATVGCCKRG